MAFGNISTFHLPIAANAGTSLWGTDVRKLNSTADGTADGTTAQTYGTNTALQTRTADPYGAAVSSDLDQTLYGWAIAPTDMGATGAANRFFPAGNHVLTATVTQNGLGAANVTVQMYAYKVSAAPGRTRTLLGNTSATVNAGALSAQTVITVSLALPQIVFGDDETIQYSFELQCTGVSITGRSGTFRTGLGSADNQTRIDTPTLGTLAYQNLAAGSTPTGAITKTPNKTATGGITPTNTGRAKVVLLRSTVGTITSVGSLSKIPLKFFTGSITPTPGTLARTAVKSLAGAVATAGQLSQRIAIKVLSGVITPVGAAFKTPSKFFLGAITSGGALRKVPNKVYAGAVASTGTIQKEPAKRLTATIASSGAISNRFVTKVLSGVIGTVGSLRKVPSVFKSGSVVPTGDLRKVPNKFFTGLITATPGTIVRAIVKYFAGTVGSSGAMTRREPAKILTGTITPTGVQRNVIAKFFRGFLYGPSGDGSGGTTVIRRVLNIFDD